ncbi:MAG: cysteine desulfurase family protein [Chthonomonadales bacterium]
MATESKPIYLDYNATTPLRPEVLEAMLPYLRECFGNASSLHAYGKQAKAAVERAREQVADLIGCEPAEVIFTSGGTEANNLAVRGAAWAAEQRRHIVTSAVEHPSVSEPIRYLERVGFEVTRIPVDETGRINPADVAPFLRGDTLLLSVMLAQNETGALMPVPELAEMAHARGALVHTDAAQAIGKVRVRVNELGVDLLSVAGHKLYGPKGVGALFVRRGVRIAPVLVGAGQERGLRPGTEAVALIVGLGEACSLAAQDLEQEAGRLRSLRDELLMRLRSAIPQLRVISPLKHCLPNTLNVAFPGVGGNAVLDAAPEIAASTGSACHAGSEAPSPVLTAMGLSPAEALSAVRLSLGRFTTRDEVQRAADGLIRAYRTLDRTDPSAGYKSRV